MRARDADLGGTASRKGRSRAHHERSEGVVEDVRLVVVEEPDRIRVRVRAGPGAAGTSGREITGMNNHRGGIRHRDGQDSKK